MIDTAPLSIVFALPRCIEHAYEDAPHEAVGWVYDDGTTRRFINQARSEHRWLVGEAQIRDALTERPDLPIAMYHSHPHGPGEYSSTDAEFMAMWPGMLHLIVAEDGVVLYRVNAELDPEVVPWVDL